MCQKNKTVSPPLLRQVNMSLQNNWVSGPRVEVSVLEMIVRGTGNHATSLSTYLCLTKAWGEEMAHQSAVMAHDGFPQRVVYQDLLVLNVHELADTPVERALGTDLTDLTLTWDAQNRQASVAPNAHRCPRPGDFGIS